MARSSTARRPPVRRNPARKSVPVVQRPGPGAWMAGARPRTLPLSVAPVALGWATAPAAQRDDRLWLAFLCLAVAVLLQVGVNFANDYSDGVRGTDRDRVGPSRLTASGAVRPRTVLAVAVIFLSLAAVSGLVIVVATRQWWLLGVGAVALAAAWFYTGGKRPYGYAGLGELAVFVFFGLAATAGTMFVLAGYVDLFGWLCAVAIGCIACAVLVANNLRDIDQDRAVGKRTLSVRIGARASRVLYGVLMAVPFVILAVVALFFPKAWLVFLTLLAAGPAVLIAATAKTSRELVLVLTLTGVTALLYGSGLAAAIVL